MSKHTPGPWVIRSFPTAQYARGQLWVLDAIPDADGKVVANAIAAVASSNDDDAANAQLIAAAPDMLNACKVVADKLNYLVNLWSNEAITKGVIDTLRAAIAKAEGNDDARTP